MYKGTRIHNTVVKMRIILLSVIVGCCLHGIYAEEVPHNPNNYTRSDNGQYCSTSCAEMQKTLETVAKNQQYLHDTFLKHLSVHENNQDSPCSATWIKIYEHGPNGQRLFGDLGDLINAIVTGASVKIMTQNGYVTSAQTFQSRKGHITVQALFHVSVSNRSFQDNAYWWFSTASTTGQWYMARYNVGEHVSRGDSEVRYKMTWFIRRSCYTQPTLRSLVDGTAGYGSPKQIISAIRNGYDIRVSGTESYYSFTPDNLEVTSEHIAAQSLWHVSQMDEGDRNIFQKNAYWWFTIWTSNGKREMSRWSVGDHISRGQNSDRVSTEWFVDPCWKLAYRHDENGGPIEGDLSVLLSAVENGHRVRVLVNNVAFEPTVLRFFSDSVEALSMDAVTKNAYGTFEKDVSWLMRSASTNGTYKELKTLVGDSSTSVTTSSAQMAWFVDTREWMKALHVAADGDVIDGSAADMLSRVKKGADVRYVIPHLGKSGGLVALQADNIQVYDSIVDLDVMHIRYPNLAETPSISLIFSLSNLKGNVHVSEWWLGVHRKKVQYNVQVEARWFVSV